MSVYTDYKYLFYSIVIILYLLINNYECTSSINGKLCLIPATNEEVQAIIASNHTLVDIVYFDYHLRGTSYAVATTNAKLQDVKQQHGSNNAEQQLINSFVRKCFKNSINQPASTLYTNGDDLLLVYNTPSSSNIATEGWLISYGTVSLHHFNNEDNLLDVKEYAELNGATAIQFKSSNKIESTPSFTPAKDQTANKVENLVKEVSQTKLKEFLSGLTSIYTRHSESPQAFQASYFLSGYLIGLGLEPEFFYFKDGYIPNVIAEIKGSKEPEKIVVIGAHYDCRMANRNNITARAPGANDDGSGSASLAEIARVFQANNATFDFTVRFCFFAGEEQGLVGSKAYADYLKANGANVIAMLQGDMLAYNAPGTKTQLDFPSLFVNKELTEQCVSITKQYVPDIVIGTTTSCCSDQQSFVQAGYAATAYNEGGGYTIDPEYHSTLDTIDRAGYDFLQLQQITQAILAATAVLSQIE